MLSLRRKRYAPPAHSAAMDRWGWLTAAAITLLVLAAALLLVGNPLAEPGEYERATVTVVDDNGTRLATVDVRIADTPEKRRLGLSNTTALAHGEGMLFVHDSEGRYTYVMREMDFPLDIVFIDSEGRITAIHHAPVPEEIPGGNGNFPGRGKYVLEVPRGFTNATDADVGDRVEIPAGVEE